MLGLIVPGTHDEVTFAHTGVLSILHMLTYLILCNANMFAQICNRQNKKLNLKQSLLRKLSLLTGKEKQFVELSAN